MHNTVGHMSFPANFNRLKNDYGLSKYPCLDRNQGCVYKYYCTARQIDQFLVAKFHQNSFEYSLHR